MTKFLSLDNALSSKWDELVRLSPDGWSYGLAGWQRIVVSVEEWGFTDRCFAVEEDGRLVAVVPLHYRAETQTLGSSGWGGCGPIIANGLAAKERERIFRQCIDRCIEIAREVDAARFQVSCSPVTTSSIENRWGVNPFVLCGMKDTSLIAQVISLEQPEDDLWKALSKTARYLVRKSRDAGYRVEERSWRKMLDLYYDMHRETYARSGLPPHPRSYFQGIAEKMAPIGAARLFTLVTPAGEPIAFHNMATLGCGAYYHTGCSRSGGEIEGGGYLLMWEAIRATKAAGVAWFDCGWIFPGTTNTKQQGLTLFKTRFGGEPHRSMSAEFVLEKPLAPPPPPSPPANPCLQRRIRARIRTGISRLARTVR